MPEINLEHPIIEKMVDLAMGFVYTYKAGRYFKEKEG